MKCLATAAAIMLLTVPAQADRFVYACRDRGKESIIRMDTTAGKMMWEGKTYVIRETFTVCPRRGWKVSGGSKSFDFCTATQGTAFFKDGSQEVQCDQAR